MGTRVRGLVRVTVNMAVSLDGRVAGPEGQPLDLSSEQDWARVHRLRAEHDAILVGIGTVLQDDPRLTARTDPPPEDQPLRVILDSTLRTPADAQVLDERAGTLIATTARAGKPTTGGAEQAVCGSGDRVDLDVLLALLEDRGVTSVLVEGGPTVAASFLGHGLVDRVHLYVAPRVLGEGPSLWEALAGQRLDLGSARAHPLGEGSLLTYEVGP